MLSSCKDEKVGILTTTTEVLNLKTLDDNQSLAISCSESWTAKSSESWCKVSDITGTGNKEVKVYGKNNFTGYSREATITISAGDKTKLVKVTQDVGKLLFEENFTENSRNWIYERDSLTESMSNGIFTIKNIGKAYAYFVGVKSILSDYTGNYMITMKYNHITGDRPFGLMFASKAQSNYYHIYFYSQGYYVVTKTQDGVTTKLIGTQTIAVNLNNIIYLIKNGNLCDVYVNDVKLTSFSLSTPFGSYAGMVSFPNSEIGVDYLRVIKQ